MTQTISPKDLRLSPLGLLRTAALPLEDLNRLSETLELPLACSEAEIITAARNDRDHCRRWMSERYDLPEVQEGLAFATPDLTMEIRKKGFICDGEPLRGHEVSLLKYLQRIYKRSTPFGLFAGVTPVPNADRTSLQLSSKRLRGVRLDTDFVFKCIQGILSQPALRRLFPITPNTSLYRVGDRFRYAKMVASNPKRKIDGTTGGCRYDIVSIEADEGLSFLLNALKTKGEWSRKEVTNLIHSAFQDVTEEEAEGYLDDLLDHQVLVSDLQLRLTTTDLSYGVLERLQARLPLHPITRCLEGVRDCALSIMDGECIQDILIRAKAFLSDDYPVHSLFKIDSKYLADAAGIGPEVLRGVQDIARVLHANSDHQDNFSDLKKAFSARFGSQFVPLPIALDAELGIGDELTGSSTAGSEALLAGVPRVGYARPDRIAIGPRGSFFMAKIRAMDDSNILNLSKTDITALSQCLPDHGPRERGCCVNVSLLEEAGRKVLLLNAGMHGPVASRTMARFAYMDEGLEKDLVRHGAFVAQANPEAVYAELVHIVPGKMGNLTSRPRLSDYEIVYLGGTDVPPEKVITAEDLHLGLLGDRFVLVSQRLGKVVVPRLSAAHAYGVDGLPIYQFLSMLQVDGLSGLEWNWDGLERVFPFLPRVTHDDVILSPATWITQKGTWDALAGCEGDLPGVHEVRRIRRALNLPRFVVLAEGESRVSIDFESVAAIQLFLSLISRRATITLQEDLWTTHQSQVQGASGRHAHELVLSVEDPGVDPDIRNQPPLSFNPDLVFPFEDMLYMKVYSGWAVAEDVLRQIWKGCIAPLERSGALGSWFFIRYSDENGKHLRIRLFGKGIASVATPLFRQTLEGMLNQGLVWKIQSDTYEREIARYGGPAFTEAAERVFRHDSDLVAHIALCEKDEERPASLDRWKNASRSLHGLLKQFYPAIPARLRFLERVLKDTPDYVKRAHGAKFREHRPFYDQLVAGRLVDTLTERFEARNAATLPDIARMRQELGEDSFFGVALSHCHMAVNRMVRINQPQVESILYDMLRRAYESQEKQRASASSYSASGGQAVAEASIVKAAAN